MQPFIEVTFLRRARDRSLEAAVHRWVARFEAMNFAVRGTVMTIEPTGRRSTTATLSLTLADDASSTAASCHEDAYVAISDVFRAVRLALLDRAPPSVRTRMLAFAD